MSTTKKRDVRFDIMKAVAILLVFIGHIMQYGFKSYTGSSAFNIIWALQIPLFMFISGYFSASRKQVSAKECLSRIGKRAVSYLLPFASYFYIIKVLVLGQYERNIVAATLKLAYHLEASLWFLWVVFVLSAVFVIGDYYYGRAKHPVTKLAALAVAVLVLLLPWVVVCFKLSTTLLGSKYVLYYSLFFGAGFLLRKYQTTAAKLLQKQWLADMVFTVCLGIFAVIVFNTQLCQEEDGLLNTVLRVVAGGTGIVVVGMLCWRIFHKPDSRLQNALRVIGENTLEIYAVHLVMVTILPKVDIEIFTCKGYIYLAVYTVVIAALTCGVICLLKATKLTNLIFFGKLQKNKNL